MSYSKWDYVKKSIVLNLKLIRQYGFSYGGRRLFLGIIPKRIRNTNYICVKMGEKCDRMAKEYLKKYRYVIENYNAKEQDGACVGADSNIWIFWWQGMEQAPDLVKTCVASIKKHAEQHPVIVLDQDNYREYVTLPVHVMDKFRKGKITVTHFSDLLRVVLLYKYGGIWMDATLYMTREFDKEIENASFYSINHCGDREATVRLGQWTAFFLASGKGNAIIGMLRELFFEYWKTEEELIVYLLVDYFLTLIYENDTDARKVLKNLPVSNRDLFALCDILHSDCSALGTLDRATYLYKLSYKMNFQEEIHGRETVYHRLVHGRREC